VFTHEQLCALVRKHRQNGKRRSYSPITAACGSETR
jgi:hypothetical protein